MLGAGGGRPYAGLYSFFCFGKRMSELVIGRGGFTTLGNHANVLLPLLE